MPHMRTAPGYDCVDGVRRVVETVVVAVQEEALPAVVVVSKGVHSLDSSCWLSIVRWVKSKEEPSPIAVNRRINELRVVDMDSWARNSSSALECKGCRRRFLGETIVSSLSLDMISPAMVVR